MITVAALATELGCQPDELKAWADLGNVPDDAEIDSVFEANIREVWDWDTSRDPWRYM